MMNILFTCAGRRNYLINYFQNALGSTGKVYAADSNSYVSAFAEAHKGFTMPLINNNGYIDEVLNICIEYDIGMVISLNDYELPLLAKAKEGFSNNGIMVIISSPEVVDICFDKWRSLEFYDKVGLKYPETYLTLEDTHKALSEGRLEFPVVVKPRWGSGSLCIEEAYSYKELELIYELVKKRMQRKFACDSNNCVIIQARVEGKEYGIDVVNDLNGRYVTSFVKEKVRMRAGETDIAVSIHSDEIEEVGRCIGNNLKHVGNLDCDIFKNEKGLYVLEMNPRFGGGYPFSHMAGADLPSALIAWAKGEEVKEDWLNISPGVVAAKCDHLVRRKGND